ncbi:hypothetical protein, partial [Hydrogenophaga sp. MI9]|uniref:hypothetical protein n=1 Tax=Hydrogenophaga sp. MI9 TaxID=3453719 RepID=UPI003EEC0722
RCSRTMRTARSRTSGENWFDFLLMALSSQGKEPPQNPGRFKGQGSTQAQKKIYERLQAAFKPANDSAKNKLKY